MRVKTVRWLLAVLLLAGGVGLAACGGDSAVPKAEVIEKGNEICSGFGVEVERFWEQFEKDFSAKKYDEAADSYTRYLDKGIDMLGQLSGLKSDEDQDVLDRMAGQKQEIEDAKSDLVAAVQAGDEKELERVWSQLSDDDLIGEFGFDCDPDPDSDSDSDTDADSGVDFDFDPDSNSGPEEEHELEFE